MIKQLRAFFNELLTQDHINSRFVFLLHGVVVSVGSAALVVGFIISNNRESYPMMLTALGGGGVGAAVGRYFTKKNGTPAAAPDPADQPSQPTT